MQTRDTLDRVLGTVDIGLRTVWGHHHAHRARPVPVTSAGTSASTSSSTAAVDDVPMTEAERALAGALMRVNHVGEVCAQALYTAQALATRNATLREHFTRASAEETDHLAWTEQRLQELGDRRSWLTPLWYAGAFGIGLAAGKLAGDNVSLGFVVETERQVEAHLAEHLDTLPPEDRRSRAILAVMKDDEIRHAEHAESHGARGMEGIGCQGFRRCLV